MDNKEQEFLKVMMQLAKEAGELAEDFIGQSQPSLKSDASVITLADQAISQLTRQHLKSYLDQGHLLIDEEDPKRGDYLNQDILNKAPYIWSVDPIDGTRLYANRMPLYGFSIGLLKDLKPYMGVVYFPALKEIFVADGEKAYYVTGAFTEYQQYHEIKPVHVSINAMSLFFCNDTFFEKFFWQDKDFHIMIHACAVVNLCWSALGRSAGCFLKCHLWDVAGSWPIIKAAGLDLRRISDGAVMDRIEVDLLTTGERSWQMKEYYLISDALNFQAIKSRIAKR